MRDGWGRVVGVGGSGRRRVRWGGRYGDGAVVAEGKGEMRGRRLRRGGEGAEGGDGCKEEPGGGRGERGEEGEEGVWRGSGGGGGGREGEEGGQARGRGRCGEGGGEIGGRGGGEGGGGEGRESSVEVYELSGGDVSAPLTHGVCWRCWVKNLGKGPGGGPRCRGRRGRERSGRPRVMCGQGRRERSRLGVRSNRRTKGGIYSGVVPAAGFGCGKRGCAIRSALYLA